MMRKKGNCSNCGKFYSLVAKGLCVSCFTRYRNKNKHENSPMIECACGCQMLLHSINHKGLNIRYIKGHQPSGDKHWNWKGYYYCNGYKFVFAPYHPFTNIRKCVREHRLIYEKHYNCCLLPWIEIHHINGIKKDNSIDNLLPVTTSEHMKIEMIGNKHGIGNKGHTGMFIDMSDRRCSNPRCKNPDKTSMRKGGRPSWLNDGKGGFLCGNCHQKEYRDRKKIVNIRR